MRDDRITLELFTDVLEVLHRHGFTRGDDVHAGRAALLGGDLARIYEGTQDYPYVRRPLHRTPIPPLEPAGQDSHDPVILPASERKTMLIALDIAAGDMRNRAGMCNDCPDQSCVACESRLRDARAYDQLTGRILQTPKPTRTLTTAKPSRPTLPVNPGSQPTKRPASDFHGKTLDEPKTRRASPSRAVSVPQRGQATAPSPVLTCTRIASPRFLTPSMTRADNPENTFLISFIASIMTNRDTLHI